ncbi:hypothetical protein RAS1_37740 [Phycisphaerae bacterium RAS1]|nr:hypothetical protein RAS1_37740 [Phycisphaerae bacterium RAS1]
MAAIPSLGLGGPLRAADLEPVLAAPRPAPRPWLVRSRRVLLTLACVWVLHVFDLGFTLLESVAPSFYELNPIAARLLGSKDYVLYAYKFSLLGVGSFILLWLRRYTVAELASWFLLAASFYVGVRWYSYYWCVFHGRVNPMIAT